MHSATRAAIAFAALFVAIPDAHAWWVEDPLHLNCHERISHSALLDAMAAGKGYVKDPAPLSKDDQTLFKGLQWDASKYSEQNLYALSLVLGARLPDALGAPDFDFYQLSEVHNAHAGQGDHCLRRDEEDGPEGDLAALTDCKAAIEREYWLALRTLDEDGNVDPDARDFAPEYVPFVGRTLVPVSAFYLHAGVAMHTIEDSFTHSFRDPADGKTIRHLFNWGEQVRGTLDEKRDGHGHEGFLDNCEFQPDDKAFNSTRMQWSVAATSQFLQALVEKGSRAERQKRLDQFFKDWFTHVPDCTVDNDYCDHPVQVYSKGEGSVHSDNYKPGGCSTASGGAMALLALAGLGALRRRRKALALAAALLLVPATASAAEGEGPKLEPGWKVEARASMSVQNPAYAVGAWGGRQFLHGEVGAFAELNPWYSVEKRAMHLGSTNAGVYAHFHHLLRPDLKYRLGAGVGASILNQELYGSSAGTTGIYLNLRLLGLMWQFSDRTALTVDAFDMALPAPQLTGWPVLYAQHRFTVGLQF